MHLTDRNRIWFLCTFLMCIIPEKLSAGSYNHLQYEVDTLSSENLLSEAKSQFDIGEYDHTLSLLQGNSVALPKRSKKEHHQLLASCYIELDRSSDARNEIFEILKLDPLYKPPADVVQDDFIRYFSEIKVRPLLSLSYSLGLNKTFLSNTNSKPVFKGEQYDETENTEIGWQMSVSVSGYISDKFSVESGFGYSEYGYDKTYRYADEYYVYYQENISYFDVPLLIKYHVTVRKSPINLAFYTGPDIWFLNKSESDINISDLQNAVNNENIIFNKNAYNNQSYLKNIDNSQKRTKIIPGWTLGSEISFVTNRSKIGLVIFYTHAFKNTNSNAESVDSEPDLNYYYYHNDSEYKVRVTGFSLRYCYRFKYHLKQEVYDLKISK